ncbi:hypothetical protein DVH24_039382 [Malus domestica]|uniref:ATP synthase 24 kDa subunit, mitochondrial n=1 Tax=Malus domestica TaxID=3750 RepID=A0A498I3M4_MALDO|nr:hypothetical protein DVH24_039382 [Malus domestica]
MAFSSRLLSKSRQLCGNGVILQQDRVIPVRYFAKEASRPVLKGDEMLKNIFLDVKKKFETALGILRKEKITIDPEDPAAVSQYAKVMKTISENLQRKGVVGNANKEIDREGMRREKGADLFSESQRIKHTIQTRTQDVPDARTYLLTLKEIRIKRGLTDELGAEAMMMDALEKVEKELKLGIRKEDLPKYEEQLELKKAKAQLEELKKDALEAMETQKKREEFKDEAMVDVKSLDIRNFI